MDAEIEQKRSLYENINSKIRSTLLELLCFWPIVLLFFVLVSLRLDHKFESLWSYLFILVWWILVLAVPRVAIFHYIRWEIIKNEQLRGWYSHRVFTTIFEAIYSENDGSVPEISMALIGVVFFSILLPLRLDGVNIPWTVALALPGLPSALAASIYRISKTTRFKPVELASVVLTAVFVEVFLLVLGLKLDGVITASWWLVNIPIFVLDFVLPALVAAPYVGECVVPVFLIATVWFSPLILFHLFIILKITGTWSASWAVVFVPLHVWWVLLFISFWAFVFVLGTAK